MGRTVRRDHPPIVGPTTGTRVRPVLPWGRTSVRNYRSLVVVGKGRVGLPVIVADVDIFNMGPMIHWQ